MSKVMLESAGRACPDKERLVRDCIDPAMEAESTRLIVDPPELIRLEVGFV